MKVPTWVLINEPWEDVEPLDCEVLWRQSLCWWGIKPLSFSLSLSLRPTSEGLGICQVLGFGGTTGDNVVSALVFASTFDKQPSYEFVTNKIAIKLA